ncbi:MAG: hypothetical protein ABIL09_15700 [Gemmatimonadota bacterium]
MSPVALSIFAVLAVAALAAGGLAVAARSLARASVGLTALAASLAAVLAGFLETPYLAGAVLLAGAGLAAAIGQVGARGGWRETGGRTTGLGRMIGLSAAAVLVGVALFAVAVRRGPFVSPPGELPAADPVADLAGIHVYAFLIATFLALAAIIAVTESRASAPGGRDVDGAAEAGP